MVAQGGPHLRGDPIGARRRVDQHAAIGVFRRDLAIGVAQILVKLDVFCLEPVGRAGPAPRGSALQPDFDGHVEDDGEVRLEVAEQIWRVVLKKLDPAAAPIQFEQAAANS